jgi:SOS response regulatory protein OraA/RecX
VAARLLARVPLTEAALHERLVAKGYQQGTAARTVARCRELGYADDERLAFERARTMRLRGAGSLKIAADLTARGLPEDLIAAAIEASLDGEPERAWAERALARARAPRGARAWRLLEPRGFPEEILTDVLGEPA